MNRAARRACSCATRRWPKPRHGRQAIRRSWQSDEQEFLAACRQAQKAVERERRQSRRIRILGIVAGVVAILAIAAAVWGLRSSQKRSARRDCRGSPSNCRGKAKLAQAQLDRQAGLALLQEAYALKEKGDAQGAIDKFRAAKATKTDLGIDVETEIADVRRQVATRLVQEGEALAKDGDFPAAEAKFKAALALEPPPDTPVYVYVPAGAVRHGGEMDRRSMSREHPQHRSLCLPTGSSAPK